MRRKALWVVGGFIVVAGGVACAYPAGAQAAHEKLTHAYALVREGHPAEARVELQALLDAKSLDAAGTGKAWNILGLADEDEGSYLESRRAFERSVSIYESLPDSVKDYAMALDDFGGLYVMTGQLDLAIKFRQKALGLYEETGDHAGMTRASSNLAGIAFSRQKTSEGRRYLQRASKEARMTTDLDEDDLASIASMQGWLAQLQGDAKVSASRYSQSLELLRKRHGEEHPFVGWAYLLLGRAHADAGELTTAAEEMKHGVGILGRTLGEQNPKNLTAEITYSRVLDLSGAHVEAAQMKAKAEQGLKEEASRQCSSCTVSAAAFR